MLITGGTGYIGFNFSKFITEQGYSVSLLVRATSDLRNMQYSKNLKIHLYNGQLDSIQKIFLEDDIDVVCHLATNYQNRNDSEYLLELDDVSIKLTIHLLSAASNKKNFMGFINVGTIWQLNKTCENSYTLFKIFQDELTRLYSIKHGIKVISLLLTDSYGPSDWRPKLLNQLSNSALNKNHLFINNPENKLGLIFIADVCEALYHSVRLLITQSDPYRVYKLEAIESFRIIDIVRRIEELLGYKLNVTFGDIVSFNKNPEYTNIEPLPGWTPRIDIDTGLKYLLGIVEK
jgi:nucleoside-diphosphate-sugar epimerase